MLNAKKTILVAALSAALSPLAHAELTANIGVTSDYMWRGVTQTNATGDGAAFSGGIDWAGDSGFYVGTWASNVDWADYEWDIYGGYGGSLGELSYDINTIYYIYDDDADANFWELGGSLSFKWFTVGLQYTLDGDADDDLPFSEGDLYYYAGASFELQPTWTLGLTVGHYDFDTERAAMLAAGNPRDVDYTHYQVDIGKSVGEFGDLTFSAGAIDDDANGFYAQGDDLQIWLSWSKSF